MRWKHVPEGEVIRKLSKGTRLHQEEPHGEAGGAGRGGARGGGRGAGGAGVGSMPPVPPPPPAHDSSRQVLQAPAFGVSVEA